MWGKLVVQAQPCVLLWCRVPGPVGTFLTPRPLSLRALTHPHGARWIRYLASLTLRATRSRRDGCLRCFWPPRRSCVV